MLLFSGNKNKNETEEENEQNIVSLDNHSSIRDHDDDPEDDVDIELGIVVVVVVDDDDDDDDDTKKDRKSLSSCISSSSSSSSKRGGMWSSFFGWKKEEENVDERCGQFLSSSCPNIDYTYHQPSKGKSIITTEKDSCVILPRYDANTNNHQESKSSEAEVSNSTGCDNNIDGEKEYDLIKYFLTIRAEEKEKEKEDDLNTKMNSSAPSILQHITGKTVSKVEAGDDVERSNRQMYEVVSPSKLDDEAKKEEEFDLQYKFDIQYEIEYESEIKERIINRRPSNDFFGFESPLMSPDFNDGYKTPKAKSLRERMQSLVGSVTPPQLESKDQYDFKIDLIQ
jgi:hypothetical protein